MAPPKSQATVFAQSRPGHHISLTIFVSFILSDDAHVPHTAASTGSQHGACAPSCEQSQLSAPRVCSLDASRAGRQNLRAGAVGKAEDSALKASKPATTSTMRRLNARVAIGIGIAIGMGARDCVTE